MSWIGAYLGPPDIIDHEACKTFIADASRTNSAMLHIETNSILVEATNSVSIEMRNNALIRRAYKGMCQNSPDLDKETVLQMSVKAVNDSVGSDGSVPTLLIF